MTKWPIITSEEEEAVLDVLKNVKMSGTDITMKFEQEFAEWIGVKYALGFNNGTASLLAAMYACGVRKGDEIICPSVTYWASCLQAMTLGATVVFANVKDDTLCIDPEDIRKFDANLGPAEKSGFTIYGVPWLKKFIPSQIEEYANAFKKVAANYKELLDGDKGNPSRIGGWHFFKHSQNN